MSEAAPGADRHLWQTELEGLEEPLRSEPAEALPELLDLVERMLRAAGWGEAPGQPAAPDVEAGVERARELVARRDAGGEVRADDAQQAAAELRELARLVLEHPEAETGADLRGTEQG